MNSATNVEPLAKAEWDFEAVPKEELLACCYWEHARECMSFIGYQLEQLKPAWTGKREKDELLKEILGNIEKEGFDSESFLGRLYETDAGYSDFIHFLMSEVTLFSPPWSRLPSEVCRGFAKEAAKTPDLFTPIGPARIYELELLWEENATGLKKVRANPALMAKDDDAEDAEGYQVSHPVIGVPTHQVEKHGPTLVGLAVDFRRFSNSTILAAVADWLRGNRPSDCPEPKRNGKKLSDLRFNLRCLGVMRLLHRHTFEQIDKEIPEIWESAPFRGAKWRDANKWYDARRHVLKTYHELFPFLERNEQPLHWQTKGDRKKRGLSDVPAK